MGEGPTPAPLCCEHRVASLALQAAPVWLWRADLTGIVWANAAGAACFRADTLQELVTQRFSPTDQRLAQVTRIVGTLHPSGSPRLARLRGFVPGIARPMLCTVSRIVVSGLPVILIAAQAAAGPNLPLATRITFLMTGSDEAMAAFAPDGRVVAATQAGRSLLGSANTAASIGTEALVAAARADGAAAGATPRGRVSVTRVGDGDEMALIAVFADTSREIAGTSAGAHALGGALSAGRAGEPGPLWIDPPVPDRRVPLRFVWQMDQHGRFTLGSDEFVEAIGWRTGAVLGRAWSELAAELDLDPDNAVLRAIETRETWSGIVVTFPIDGIADRVRVELSGLPVYDRDRTYLGYRGFGVCRDVERLTQLGRVRRPPPALPAAAPAMVAAAAAPQISDSIDDTQAILALLHRTGGELSFGSDEEDGSEVKTAEAARRENVLLFPATAPEAKSRLGAAGPSPGALSVGEHDAFQEIARRLQARLGSSINAGHAAASHGPAEPTSPADRSGPIRNGADEEPVSGKPCAADPARDRGASGLATFLDKLPVGLLVYRPEEPLYANRAFLAATGFSGLEELAAGGFASKFAAADDVDAGGQALTVIGRAGVEAPIAAKRITVPWGEEQALALVLADQPAAADGGGRGASAAPSGPPSGPPSGLPNGPGDSEGQIRELRAVIDAAFDGLVVLTHDGWIVSANHSAEMLLGYAPSALARRPFGDLFAADSRGSALAYLDRVRRGDAVAAGGRELTGQTRQGQGIPLLVVLGAMPKGGDKLYAILRDLTPQKKAEDELTAQKQDAERAAAGHAQFLETLTDSVRGTLGSINGNVDVMLEERFGPLGNERYRGCVRDLRAASEHIGGLLDNTNSLSRAESGALDLSFVPVDFNAMVQSCIKALQADANRDRIIIRSALSPRLRSVLADAQSLRQVVSNLLANAVRHAGAGGQVIVSTGETERGHVVFRVRDTGAAGLKASDPAGQGRKEAAISPDPSRGSSVDMVLTRTLAEANRGTLNISSKVNEGTLFEVSFPSARIPAE